MVLIILISVLGFFYTVSLVFLRIGLSKLQPGRQCQEPFVSVIVASRNEENNLPACLRALQTQEFPHDRIEFIIVNDRSTDGTQNIIDEFIRSDPRFKGIRILEEDPEMAPKKWALHNGIRSARGEVIITTDADCIPPPRWVAAMTRYFEADIGMVAGFSPLEPISKPTLFNQLLALDGLALAGVSAGGIGMGLPLTCTGRNLAYRKSIYEEVEGFSGIGQFVSGDDDLFLHHVRKKTRANIRYAVDPDSFVPSTPSLTLTEFFYQRTRHASKGFHYRIPLTLSLIAVYMFNVMLLIGWLIPGLGWAWSAALFSKIVFEYIFIEGIASLFTRKYLLRYFLIAALLHIPYVVFFGLWAQLGTFRWKGQVHDKIQSGVNPD